MLGKLRLGIFAAVLMGSAVALAGWMPEQQAADAPGRPKVSAFNAGQVRPKEDPAMVSRGKTLYGVNCQACHGLDLRGGDLGGPNLLRSEVTLTDQHGENIVPIIQGGRQAQGMPKIGIGMDDSQAGAAYVRSVIGTIGSQGMPPGEEKPLNIVVGDANKGHAYFTAHCGSCHSPEGDLKGFATKVTDPKALQARWIAGGKLSGYDGAATKVTADVTTAPGHKVTGTVTHVDEFLISLKLDDGSTRSFQRNGSTPRVVLHDPLEAHRDLLPKYTDQDIHDVTAYLVTLK